MKNVESNIQLCLNQTNAYIVSKFNLTNANSLKFMEAFILQVQTAMYEGNDKRILHVIPMK